MVESSVNDGIAFRCTTVQYLRIIHIALERRRAGGFDLCGRIGGAYQTQYFMAVLY
ncbi:hypothetical protein D3C86_2103840 [compost metagenome]